MAKYNRDDFWKVSLFRYLLCLAILSNLAKVNYLAFAFLNLHGNISRWGFIDRNTDYLYWLR